MSYGENYERIFGEGVIPRQRRCPHVAVHYSGQEFVFAEGAFDVWTCRDCGKAVKRFPVPPAPPSGPWAALAEIGATLPAKERMRWGGEAWPPRKA